MSSFGIGGLVVMRGGTPNVQPAAQQGLTNTNGVQQGKPVVVQAKPTVIQGESTNTVIQQQNEKPNASGDSPTMRQLNAGAIVSTLGAALEVMAKHPDTCNCPLCSGRRAISFNDPVTSGSSTAKGRALSSSGAITNASTGDRMQAVKTPLSASIASVQADAKASATQEAALASKRAAEAGQTPSAEKTAAMQNSNSAPVLSRSVKISMNLTPSAAVAQNNSKTIFAQTASRASVSSPTVTSAVARNTPSSAVSNQNIQNVQTQNIFSRMVSINTIAASPVTIAAASETRSVNTAAANTVSMTSPANTSNLSASTVASARTVSVATNALLSASAPTAVPANPVNSAATGGMSARISGLFGELKGFNPAQNNVALTANLPVGEKAIMQRPVPINLAFVQAGLTNPAVLTGANGEKLVINGQQNFAAGAVKEARAGGLIFGDIGVKETKAQSQPIISFAELSRIAHERDIQKENLSKLISLLFGKIMHKEEDDEDLEGMYGIWRDYLDRQREQKDQREKEERRKKKQKRDAELQEKEQEAVMAV
jgi:hypothetical protein